MLKKLPQFVFVAVREPGEEEFLACETNAQDAIEDDGPTLVGTYKLVEVNRLTKRVVSARARNNVTQP